MTEPQGDKPRKIIVCHPTRAAEIQQYVASLYSDVLVKPNRYVAENTAYLMDPCDLMNGTFVQHTAVIHLQRHV